MPVEQLAVDYDAQEVLDKLNELNDRTTPTRQGYLYSIAGKKTVLYDLNNKPVSVRVENIEQYIAKGFTVKNQETLQDSGQTKEDRLEELQMNVRHDTVPVIVQNGTPGFVRQADPELADSLADEDQEITENHEKRRVERETVEEKLVGDLRPVSDLDKKQFEDVEPPHMTGAGKPTVFNSSAGAVAKANAEAEEESEKARAESQKKATEKREAAPTRNRTAPPAGSSPSTSSTSPVNTDKTQKPEAKG